MNTTPRTLLLLLALLPLCLTACEHHLDDKLPDPDTGMMTDSGPEGSTVTSFALCDLALTANQPATACATSRDCAPNELCVGSGGESATCAALCFPEDCPTTSCGAGAECALLQVGEGEPLIADVNGDGSEEPIGACVLLPESNAPTWGLCNDSDGCTLPDVCIQLPGRDAGICTPPCGAYCLPTGGFQTTCVGTSGGGSVCVIPCDPALSVGQCPPQTACVTAGTGFAICTW